MLVVMEVSIVLSLSTTASACELLSVQFNCSLPAFFLEKSSGMKEALRIKQKMASVRMCVTNQGLLPVKTGV